VGRKTSRWRKSKKNEIVHLLGKEKVTPLSSHMEKRKRALMASPKKKKGERGSSALNEKGKSHVSEVRAVTDSALLSARERKKEDEYLAQEEKSLNMQPTLNLKKKKRLVLSRQKERRFGKGRKKNGLELESAKRHSSVSPGERGKNTD